MSQSFFASSIGSNRLENWKFKEFFGKEIFSTSSSYIIKMHFDVGSSIPGKLIWVGENLMSHTVEVYRHSVMLPGVSKVLQILLGHECRIKFCSDIVMIFHEKNFGDLSWRSEDWGYWKCKYVHMVRWWLQLHRVKVSIPHAHMRLKVPLENVNKLKNM